MRLIQAALAAVVLAAALVVGARGYKTLPAVGPLLDPANGIWHVAANADLPSHASAEIGGLDSTVSVVYDDRGVPHIFAATEADAQRALGYVVARDRLFQLELQARAGAGTLTELLGARALPVDRDMRALGLPAAAEWKLARILAAAAAAPSPDSRFLSRTPSPIIAFSQGVNSYLSHLSPRDYPLEYKLLGRAPAPWQPINSIHLFDRMAQMLAYNNEEFTHLAAAARVGRAAADALFPVNSPIQEPVQPSRRAEPRADFRPIPPPGKPDTLLLALAREIEVPGFARAAEGSDVSLGSNSWAVSPRRTQGGHALLAGDPHLELTLPSIWYEAQLTVPGVLDAYGVTIPGAPSLIIGFNRDVAWTFTNTEGDVVDRWVETVDDDAHPTKQRVNGAWRPITARVEEYRDPAGRVIAADTMYWSYRGPMRRTAGRWISMRWTALDSSTALTGFLRIARARTAAEWMSAMADYGAPAQNMLVADRAGTIAIRSTGYFPVRPGNGRGDWLRDGSTTRTDWTGRWTVKSYPQATNPAQGYLASNNQQMLDPADDPRYLGADWPSPWRAIRINELLRANASVTPDAMRRYQTDPGSARAQFFVPAFLAAAQARARTGDPGLAEAATLLARWDRTYAEDDRIAVLFEYAMNEMHRRTFDELRGDGRRLVVSDAVVAELLQQPRNPWWDDRETNGTVETRDDILAASLAAAYRRAMRELGDPDEGGWRWGRLHSANIRHLLHIPSLSALLVPSNGGVSTLNPVAGDGTDGASWRMVVEMGPEVHAWGTYPGGQSGNPASARYLDRLVAWSKGELDTLRFPRSAAGLEGRSISSTLTLTPAAR
jgi:penicillin G amidase